MTNETGDDVRPLSDEEKLELLALVLERRFGEKTRLAILAALDGLSWRNAAEEAGLATHQDAHKVAASVPGLLEACTRAMLARKAEANGGRVPPLYRRHLRRVRGSTTGSAA